MRIGDVAAASGLTTKTIRFYEQAGLLPRPPRTAGSYRDYPEQTIKRLAFIRDAQSAGLTLAEIRSVLALRDAGASPCAHVTALIDRSCAASPSGPLRPIRPTAPTPMSAASSPVRTAAPMVSAVTEPADGPA
jgi:hypothetical protein